MPTLDPFLDELRQPQVLAPSSDDGNTRIYRVRMRNGKRKLHSQLPVDTPFWGYEGLFPGPTIEVPHDRDVSVTFLNDLEPPADPANPRTQWPFAIDPDQPGGMPYFVPPSPWTVIHLHGSPTRPEYDGWTDNAYFRGERATHHYPRQERAALLWYHDHAGMITRLNVYAGLAGFYVVRDAAAEAALPSGEKELFLMIQDREFEATADGTAFTGRFQYQPLTSNSKFTRGRHILVNGLVTPFQTVERACYRLRILNGSNARFLRLGFGAEGEALTTKGWTVIGVDGGFLTNPVLNPTTRISPEATAEMVVLAPAERLDVLVDFSEFDPGTNLVLATAGGDGIYSKDVLQFRVKPGPAAQAPEFAPPAGRSPRLASPYSLPHHDEHEHPPAPAGASRARTIGLYLKNKMQTINGMGFHDRVEEQPEFDTEEIWSFLNVTVDDHPLHLHLVNFEVVDRQEIEVDATDPDEYLDHFDEHFRMWLNDASPGKPPVPPGLRFKPDSSPVPADAYEREPKDTVRVPSFTVTRIKTKFRLHAGLYMYHCHILEHEDMEMMRPMLVRPPGMPEMSGNAHLGGHEHMHG